MLALRFQLGVLAVFIFLLHSRTVAEQPTAADLVNKIIRDEGKVDELRSLYLHLKGKAKTKASEPGDF